MERLCHFAGMHQGLSIAQVFTFRAISGTAALALLANINGCCPRPPKLLPEPPLVHTQIIEPTRPVGSSRILGYWKIADGGLQKGKVCQFTPDGRILIFDLRRTRLTEGQEMGWWSPTPNINNPEGDVLTISFSGFEPDSQVLFTRSGRLKPLSPTQGPTLQLIPAQP